MRWRHLTGMAALIVPLSALVGAAEHAGTRDYGSLGYGSSPRQFLGTCIHPDLRRWL
jgi:hypothetical protein